MYRTSLNIHTQSARPQKISPPHCNIHQPHIENLGNLKFFFQSPPPPQIPSTTCIIMNNPQVPGQARDVERVISPRKYIIVNDKPFTRRPYRKIKEMNCGKTKTDDNLFHSKPFQG